MDYQKVIEQARTVSDRTVKRVQSVTAERAKIQCRDLERKESEMWRSEIFRNGRRSVSIWIRSVKRSRLIRQ